jgi:hypothetical protein
VPVPGAETITESGAAFFWGQIEGKFPLYGVFFLLVGGQIQVGAKFLISEKAERAGGIEPPKEPSLVFDMEIKAYVGVAIITGIFEGSLAIGVAIAIEASLVKIGPLVLLQAEIDLKIIKVEVSGEFKGLFYHGESQEMCEWGGQLEINVSICFIGIHFGIEITEKSEV